MRHYGITNNDLCGQGNTQMATNAANVRSSDITFTPMATSIKVSLPNQDIKIDSLFKFAPTFSSTQIIYITARYSTDVTASWLLTTSNTDDSAR